MKSSSPFRRLWREYLSKETALGIVAIVMMLLASCATVIQVQLLQPTLDLALIDKRQDLLWWLGLAFLGLSLLRGVAGFAQATTSARLGNRVVEKLQNRLFARVLRLDVGRLIRSSAGEYVSRFTFDLQLLRETFSRALVGLVRDLFLLLAYCGLLFYNNWFLALLVVGFYPLMIWPVLILGRRLKKTSTHLQEVVGLMSGFLTEHLGALRVILANDAVKTSQKRAKQKFSDMRKYSMRAILWRSMQGPVNELTIGLALGCLVILGGREVFEGSMTPGEFTTFLAAIMLTYQPLRSLGNFNANLQEGMASAQRVFDLIDAKELTSDKKDAKEFRLSKGISKGLIKFENISIKLEGETLLDKVNLTIKPGESIALFGASGAGKSSMINALLRFLPLADGRITIDGQDIAKLTASSFRSQFALVPQELGLISDTIANNISMRFSGGFTKNMTADEQEKITLAAQKAGVLQVIRKLPLGFDTLIGTSGTRLSGGQRQRLALARAFYRNAPILLLDEASSALDREVEAAILEEIFTNAAAKTIIFITHNPDHLHYADKVAYFETGRLLEFSKKSDFLRRFS